MNVYPELSHKANIPDPESAAADLNLLPPDGNNWCMTFGDVPWHYAMRLRLEPYRVARIQHVILKGAHQHHTYSGRRVY